MEVRLQDVSLNEIGETVGTPPSSRFTGSVRRMGIVQPVLLAETTTDSGEIQYLIIDGNRRIQSARRAKLRSVPSVIMTGLMADERAQLTLVANGFRSPNYLTEFWAVKTLERNNFTTDDVMKLAGMSDSVMATRSRLSQLHREIFIGLRNGKVSQANAITIAKMDRSDQESLAGLFSRNGKLLKRDVDRKLAESREKMSSPVPRTNTQGPAQPVTSAIRFASGTNTSSSLDSASVTSPALESVPLSKPEVSDVELALPMSNSDIAVTNPPAGSRIQAYPASLNHRDSRSTSATATPDYATITPLSDAPVTEIPTTASRAVSHVRNAVLAAQVLDFSREDFLEMAGRIWDDTVEQQSRRA